MAASTTAFAQANLTAEISNPGNSSHLSVIHLADVAVRDGATNIQVQDGQTATNFIVSIAEGKTDIASVLLVLHVLLEHGRGPFSSIGDAGADLARNLRALLPYNAGAYGLLAHVSTGIQNSTDLEGRTVWNGPPRGAALVKARQAILLASGGFEVGKQYKGLQTNWGQRPTALVDGSAVAVALPHLPVRACDHRPVCGRGEHHLDSLKRL